MKIHLTVLFGILAAAAVQGQTLISTLTLPGGNTILQATGAVPGTTAGGTASAETRTLYYYGPDFGDPAPNAFDYTGTAWPYVYVNGSFTLNSGITASVGTANDGLGDYLTINGNPIYQFINDTTTIAANGNFGPWYFIETDGTATQSTVSAVPEPSAFGFLLGALTLTALAARRRRPSAS